MHAWACTSRVKNTAAALHRQQPTCIIAEKLITVVALCHTLPYVFQPEQEPAPTCSEGRNEARDQASEASADPSDFPAQMLNGPLALPSQGGTSTSSPRQTGVQPLNLRIFSFKNNKHFKLNWAQCYQKQVNVSRNKI